MLLYLLVKQQYICLCVTVLPALLSCSGSTGSFSLKRFHRLFSLQRFYLLSLPCNASAGSLYLVSALPAIFSCLTVLPALLCCLTVLPALLSCLTVLPALFNIGVCVLELVVFASCRVAAELKTKG